MQATIEKTRSEKSEKKTAAPKKERPQITPAMRLVRGLGYMSKLARRTEDRVSKWDDADDMLEAVERVRVAVEAAFKQAQKLPADFVPRKPKAPAAPLFGPGVVVSIREKVLPQYEGILTSLEVVNLTVIDVRKNRAVCRTSGGDRIILPRGHLVPAARGN